jgi:hypothetical protein
VLIALVPIAALLLGLYVRRWWALLVPVAVGGWVAAVSGVDEVPPWLLGLGYAVLGVVFTAVGVLVRRFTGRSADRS